MNTLRDKLASRAAACYRASGRGAYYFARSKLRHDPFYLLLLHKELIPAGARVLDLGCAQGLLAAWLFAVQQSYSEGAWDSSCPVPGAVEGYRGIDRNELEIRRARQAVGHYAEFSVGDVVVAQLAGATLIVLLDVLHYLDYDAQLKLLRLIRASLPAHGSLLLRVGDSGNGFRARVSGWVDRVVLRLRGYRHSELYRRPVTQWLLLLDELGFSVQEVARQQSVSYTNALLRAFPTPR